MIKGLNKAVKVKNTRTFSPEKAAARAEGVLEQIRAGQICVSEAKNQWKRFTSSPDLLVDRVIQALKYGAEPDEVRGAASNVLTELQGKVDWRAGKESIYEYANEKGVNLADVAFVFDLGDSSDDK
jgi:hypothetical protein